ncbi:class I SAM-dependent methyltransferase [Solihabitans fulvus]|uniref:Class I SAM-dependent methyltransferase n=1 Tax=Solihabitans fulvus TaxID=1892852 RepID=A0A5B2W7N9_9PSEU|nr:class I SAM-dependent methyltransferase [Solihabitans fulvus]KAA2247285.1 class I SAM-dependent methyltransferase [Solihabitans fulvus]
MANSSDQQHHDGIDRAVLDGQAFYSRMTLPWYDLIIYRIIFPLFWRCSLRTVQRWYDSRVGARHLEIGVGTGYLPLHSRFPVPDPAITLLDLSPHSLAFTARRLARFRPERIQANVLEPLPVADAAFDSVCMNLLLHCVPGSLRVKGIALAHAAKAVRPGGVVFGSTVLRQGVPVTPQARWLLRTVNRKGIFHNDEDSLDDLRQQLDLHFASSRLVVVGCVAFFEGRTTA